MSKHTSNADSPVKFAAVKILEELFQLAGCVHIFESGEQIHVTERIDCDKRQVGLALAEVVQGVGETVAVSRKEIDVC